MSCCPICKGKIIYRGLLTIECETEGCKNYKPIKTEKSKLLAIFNGDDESFIYPDGTVAKDRSLNYYHQIWRKAYDCGATHLLIRGDKEEFPEDKEFTLDEIRECILEKWPVALFKDLLYPEDEKKN